MTAKSVLLHPQGLRPGAKYFFAPLSTKTAEFEAKIGAKEAKTEHLLLVTSIIFRSNKIRLMLETHSTKLYQ